MANGMGIIDEGLWRKDKDFQKLPRMAQCTYVQVLCQKDLDTAGGLTLHLELMTKGCDELTADQLKADFKALEDRRFLFVDYDTDEILVRSYVRRVSGVGQRNNAWKSVPRNARLIASEKLRHELAVELRRLRRKEASDLADEIDPLPTQSEPPLNPVGTPSEGSTPFEPPSNPLSTEPVPVLVSRSVVGSFGKEPPQFCSAHPNGTDRACHGCGRAREIHDAWVEAKQRNEIELRRAARDACRLCDENGMRPAPGGLKRCTHQEEAHA